MRLLLEELGLRLAWSLLLFLWAGCTYLNPAPQEGTVLQPTPTLHPGLLNGSPDPAISPTSPPVPTLPAATPEADSGWTLLQPGLEQRTLRLFDEEGKLVERLFLLRLEPQHFRFEVAYRPGQPLPLSDWQKETGALVVMNGGYFTEAYQATGMVVADGVTSGSSYGDFAGMFAVTPSGPELRWLREQPYDPAEPLSAALQSFPLLVRPGGVLGFPEEDGQTARRTVIGQDRNGRFLFLVADLGYFSLHQLANYLLASDLDLDVALNLDGGLSSGIVLAEPEMSVFPLAYVPVVITVFPAAAP